MGKHTSTMDIFKFLDGVDDVEFVEAFKRPEKEKPKAAKKAKAKKS
jgi:hypothetical protein